MKNCNKLFTICVLFVFFTNSCITHSLAKPKYFTIKHENKDTGIGGFIKLSGYFFPVDSNNILLNSDYERVLLYKNGIICFPPFYPTMEVYNEDFKKTTVAKTMWGSYSFDEKEKLIYTQTILDLGAMSSMSVVKKTFKIIDSTHILLINKQIDNGKIIEVNMKYEFKEEPDILDFSTNWLLKKNWFWKKGAQK